MPGVDQRGVPACINGKMDMGAVERQSPEVIIFRDGFDTGQQGHDLPTKFMSARARNG